MAIRDPKPFLKSHLEYQTVVWKNVPEVAFGLEWILRLILIYTPWWLFPGNWLKLATDNCRLFVRRTLTDLYVLAKVLVVWVLVNGGYSDNCPGMVILLWSAIETGYALLGGIFLRDVWSLPLSYQRNLLLTLFNYVEICLFFAGIYANQEHHLRTTDRSLFLISDTTASNDHHLTSKQAIYFSFISAATIGYGDISPRDPGIQRIVVFQTIVSMVFIVVFIANITGKLGTGELSRSQDDKDENSSSGQLNGY